MPIVTLRAIFSCSLKRLNKSPRFSKDKLVIWRITDGKQGHDAQSKGLIAALGRLVEVDSYDLPALTCSEMLGCLISGKAALAEELPNPDLIVGAGRRTHGSLIALRRARGGRSVVLMRPSIPRCFFDLSIIPEHDSCRQADTVMTTRGVLNTIVRSEFASNSRGLILIGGPSAHYSWAVESLLNQVHKIVRSYPAVEWTLTTSRRTPESTLSGLERISERNLRLVPFRQTEQGWVAGQLSKSGLAWVSEDSVSMVYEALTAGAKVGLLNIPEKGSRSRVSSGISRLLEEGLVLRCTDPIPNLNTAIVSVSSFNEADRIAKDLLQKYYGSPSQ